MLLFDVDSMCDGVRRLGRAAVAD